MLYKAAFVINLMFREAALGTDKMMGVPGLEFWSQLLVRLARLYDTRCLEVPSRTPKDHVSNGRNSGQPREVSPSTSGTPTPSHPVNGREWGEEMWRPCGLPFQASSQSQLHL